MLVINLLLADKKPFQLYDLIACIISYVLKHALTPIPMIAYRYRKTEGKMFFFMRSGEGCRIYITIIVLLM